MTACTASGRRRALDPAYLHGLLTEVLSLLPRAAVCPQSGADQCRLPEPCHFLVLTPSRGVPNVGSCLGSLVGLASAAGLLVPWSFALVPAPPVPWSPGPLVCGPWPCGSATFSGLFFGLAAGRPSRGPRPVKSWGAVLANEIYDEPESPNQGACLRHMMRGVFKTSIFGVILGQRTNHGHHCALYLQQHDGVGVNFHDRVATLLRSHGSRSGVSNGDSSRSRS